MAVEALRRVVISDPRYQVAWIARDGAEAVERCLQDRPDIILMDLLMPVMDGAEATRKIMARTPCPILIVTATVDGNRNKVYEALGAGALDAVNTPVLGATGRSPETAALLYKLDVLGRMAGEPEVTSITKTVRDAAADKSPAADKLLAIGASAGGPAAVADVLKELPPDFNAAVILIQHVDAQFAQGLAEWLGQQSPLPVRLARNGDIPQPGVVLVAGTDNHLVFADSKRLTYTEFPKESPYRPSVNEFFESVVRHWRGKTVGVLLTGMGRDGATGLKALRDAGHHTIAQDKNSSVVYGMPKAAAALDAAVQILPLPQIGAAIVQRFREAS